MAAQGQPAGSALLPVEYSQGLRGGSYSFLLSFRARARTFFIPLTFLNALLIPLVKSTTPPRIQPPEQTDQTRPSLPSFSSFREPPRRRLPSPARDAVRDETARRLCPSREKFSSRPPLWFSRTRMLYRALLLSLSVTVCPSLSSPSFSLSRHPFRPSVSFLFCVL